MENKLILLEDLGMLYPTETSKLKRHYSLYKCYCGNEFKAMIRNVKIKTTSSCGCHKVKHNLRYHRLYSIWANMMYRCNNITYRDYDYYGGRGIKVCDRWHTIDNFIEDMYPTFQEGLTLDRENTNGNYELSNCRWATKTTQARNTRILGKNNTSGYRGVGYYKATKKWKVNISIDSKKIHLGYFNNALDAALAYDKYITDNNLEHTKNFS